MCAPLIAAIPMIGGALTTAGVGGAAATFSATGILTALSVASAAASITGQRSTAKAQAAAIGVQAENEREEANDAAEEEIGTRIRESRERRARALVAAGESGALGASFAASINQSIQDQNMDAALVSKQAAFTSRGIDDRANTSLASIRSPSALEAGLQIAGAGATGYQRGLSIDAKRTAPPKTDPTKE